MSSLLFAPFSDPTQVKLSTIHEMFRTHDANTLAAILQWLQNTTLLASSLEALYPIVMQIDAHLFSMTEAQTPLITPDVALEKQRMQQVWVALLQQLSQLVLNHQASHHEITRLYLKSLRNVILWQLSERHMVGPEHWHSLSMAYQHIHKKENNTILKQEFMRIMLLSLCTTGALSPLQARILNACLDDIQPLGTITDVEHADFCFSYGQALPPQRLIMAQVASDKAIYFHAHGVADALNHYKTARQNTPANQPSPLDAWLNRLPETDWRYLCEHVAQQWQATPFSRREIRQNSDNRVSVLQGIAQIMPYFIHQQGGGRTSTRGHTRTSPSTLKMPENWQVIDASENGLCMSKPSGQRHPTPRGELLALKLGHAQNWILGIVRRIHETENEEIQLGIEIISHTINLVQLLPIAGQHATINMQPALLLDNHSPNEVNSTEEQFALICEQHNSHVSEYLVICQQPLFIQVHVLIHSTEQESDYCKLQANSKTPSQII